MKIICLLAGMTLMAWNQTFPQGSWNPAGADLSFPRTQVDSLAVPAVRSSLASPVYLSLYGSIWSSANSSIPPGNSTISERYSRSVIAKEGAFVYLMDRKISSGNVMPLVPTERDSLLARTIRLLENINTDVDVGTFWTFYNPWQHRSKELINHLVAYDLLRGAGIPATQLLIARTKLVTFAGNLYQRAMASYTFLNLKFFTYQFNNHSIMTASALGLAAVVLNDNSSANVNQQPQNWINAGLYNLDNTLWMENGTYPRVSEPDTLAGYAEGPSYFKYGFENAFPFIRAMGNFLPDGYYPAVFNGITRNIRNPWHDTRYDRLYDWMNRIRMPDGSFPPIHDSSIGFGTVIMALSGKPGFNLPNPGYNADDPTYRTQFISTQTPQGAITDSAFQPLPAAGSLVFRSSWDPSAVWLHAIGKHGISLTGAKAHHQGDASSFSLAAYGELLAVDPGYPGASQADLVNKATDHNLILVDGNGPLPPTGELVSTATNTAWIENCIDLPLLDFGEVRTNYNSTEIIRKFLFIRGHYLLLCDFVNSTAPRNFTWQLHGNGIAGGSPALPQGLFQPDFSNNQGFYKRNNVTLQVRVQAEGGGTLFSHSVDSLSIGGTFRTYSKMHVVRQGQSGTLFFTTLFPYTGTGPQVTTVSTGSEACAVRIESGSSRDIAWSARDGNCHTIPADSGGFGKQFAGNGQVNFYSETAAGDFASAFLRNGDSLVAGSRVIMKGPSEMDMAWMKLAGGVMSGYISQPGTIRFYSPVPLQPLTGGFTLSFDSLNQVVTGVFTTKGPFMAGSPGITWVWSGTADTMWNNPLNWKLSGFPLVHGVPSAVTHVIIPAGSLHMPVVNHGQQAECEDLTVCAGASLTVETLRSLRVNGSVTIE